MGGGVDPDPSGTPGSVPERTLPCLLHNISVKQFALTLDPQPPDWASAPFPGIRHPNKGYIFTQIVHLQNHQCLCLFVHVYVAALHQRVLKVVPTATVGRGGHFREGLCLRAHLRLSAHALSAHALVRCVSAHLYSHLVHSFAHDSVCARTCAQPAAHPTRCARISLRMRCLRTHSHSACVYAYLYA